MPEVVWLPIHSHEGRMCADNCQTDRWKKGGKRGRGRRRKGDAMNEKMERERGRGTR